MPSWSGWPGPEGTQKASLVGILAVEAGLWSLGAKQCHRQRADPVNQIPPTTSTSIGLPETT